MSGYVQTVVSMSPPSIQNREGAEFEFEKELVSQPMQHAKRVKRHLKTR